MPPGPTRAAREFEDWASTIAGKKDILVQVSIYADESGTHDRTGNSPGSANVVVCGLASLRENWTEFCKQWQAVLNEYKVPCFHFVEWTTASAVARGKRAPSATKHNPYKHLDTKALDEFIGKLAQLIGTSNTAFVGGLVPTQKYNQERLAGERVPYTDPYRTCLEAFFRNCPNDIAEQQPPWKSLSVSFVFDQSDDRAWTSTILDTFMMCKKHYIPKFRNIAFGDRRYCLPLQAADFIAYRTRQMTEQKPGSDEPKHRSWPAVDNWLLLRFRKIAQKRAS